MPLSPPPPVTITLLTLTLAFLFCALSSPSVLAQKFSYDGDKCNAFVEGQEFYLVGGFLRQKFILDLSVSWNTSDPVFREIKGGPVIEGYGCATTNNGELFVLSVGAGFVYNPRSKSWTGFENPNFANSVSPEFAVTDPETGIIYVKESNRNFNGETTMYSVDLRTQTVNTLKVYVPEEAVAGVAWSAFLKSMVVVGRPVSLFTPSKLTESSDGWSSFIALGQTGDFPTPLCTVSAYGGSIMVFLAEDYNAFKKTRTTSVYTLDVAKQTMKKGPFAPIPAVDWDNPACAASGDHFIVWGGMLAGERYLKKPLVFNIKTEKWVSRYTPPPPPPPRPTTSTLQPSQTPTQQTNTISGPGNTSSSIKNHASMIFPVTGCLLAIILGLFV
ncbi:MAG: hypothetical protein J3Q66DRAFT_353064 [Benniella sp.]|nr:MAG: hypothetical protein J3Q66DRAFT_353064 [Benniella sp.]